MTLLNKKKITNDLGSTDRPKNKQKSPMNYTTKYQLNSTETKENRSRNIKRLQNDANSHQNTNTSTRFQKSN